ncbi:hypothetical protein EVAR_67031_1 [Eumeta japonica]|uniref:Uncharacterized protein n=1 Tax=Eumeta variegata TaxID=151549 RepID=A0A4C1ZZF3_EUMVA|nr:hypothetical protein EVAR_67031_1 [Eumeta japonica]
MVTNIISMLPRDIGRIPIVSHERADELARRATFTKKTAADYDKFLLSYAKKVIRAVSLEERQEPYAEGSIAEIQGVLHIFEERDMFLRERTALEAEIAARIERRHFLEILEDTAKRIKFLELCNLVIKRCHKFE